MFNEISACQLVKRELRAAQKARLTEGFHLSVWRNAATSKETVATEAGTRVVPAMSRPILAYLRLHSRLTGKLDPGLEPPRVQMHRFDPPPLISPRPLLITLRFEDYLDLGWFMDFRQRTKESPEFGLTADLLWLFALEAHTTISLKQLLRSWLTFSIWKCLVLSDAWLNFDKGSFGLLFRRRRHVGGGWVMVEFLGRVVGFSFCSFFS